MLKFLKLKFFTKEVVNTFDVPDYIVFSVNNFNNWFNCLDNKAVYANPGIFLRLDKFSQSHITEYIEKCYGITNVEHENIVNFEKIVRKDWTKKIFESDKNNIITVDNLPSGKDWNKYMISPSILEDAGRSTAYEAGFKDCLIEIKKRIWKNDI